MSTFGVITNTEKDIGFKYTKLLVQNLQNMGAEVKITDETARALGHEGCKLDETGVVDSSDIIICLGGDGTFLKTARKVYEKNKPILGVNLGSLGFLTEIEKNDIENTVSHLVRGEFNIEQRMMLEAAIIRNDKVIAKDAALNDIVISRGALSRILHLKTYINNVFVDSLPGDGLIVSSPTGSTAYSLSAGGPIVEPDIDLIIVTPICPHILYSRSFITTGDRVVKIIVDEEYCHEAMVTVDGQEGYEIKGGDCIEVKKAAYTVKMVRVYSRNFFNILRNKIYDRGESLRKDEV